jgi:hypothetical protein
MIRATDAVTVPVAVTLNRSSVAVKPESTIPTRSIP